MSITLARKQLQKEKQFLGQQIERVDSALRALDGSGTVHASRRTFKMSPARRRAISEGIRRAKAKAKK